MGVKLAEWNKLKKQLNQILVTDQQEIINAGLMAAGLQFDAVVHREYPPAPPKNSRYKRTGTLVRSLTYGQPYGIGRQSAIKYGTAVRYAPQVIGKKQAAIHKGRWVLLKDLLVRSASLLAQRFSDVVATEIRKRLGK